MGKQLAAPPTAMSVPNIYAYRSRFVLSQSNDAQRNDVPAHKLSMKKLIRDHPLPTAEFPVCIIGAGMAGLYTAMILQFLEIPYQIVDADTKERVGGRLFTHHFANGGPYDYFVSRIHMRLTPCSDFCVGCWGHAFPKDALHEADL